MLTAGTKLYDTDLYLWYDASQQATGSSVDNNDLVALGSTTVNATCSSSFNLTEGVTLNNPGAIDASYQLTGANGISWVVAGPGDHLSGGSSTQNDTFFTSGDEITVEAWLYLADGWSTGQICDGGGSGNTSSYRDRCSFRIKETAGSYFQCGNANMQPNLTNVDGTDYVNTVMTDKWAHYVWRYGDGSVLDESGSDKGDFWINGSKVFGTTSDPNISGIQYFNRLPICTTNLGGTTVKPGNGERFEGKLGMFRFYKKAIPATAVRNNYTGTKARWGL
tara:strand:- start:164 stop:997 length:834 start_codon:yes stop_codon:yes gene_type:complete